MRCFACLLWPTFFSLLEMDTSQAARTWGEMTNCLGQGVTDCHEGCKYHLDSPIVRRRVRSCIDDLLQKFWNKFAGCLTKHGFPITNETDCWREDSQQNLRIRRQMDGFEGAPEYSDCWQTCVIGLEQGKADVLSQTCTKDCPLPPPVKNSTLDLATSECEEGSLPKLGGKEVLELLRCLVPWLDDEQLNEIQGQILEEEYNNAVEIERSGAEYTGNKLAFHMLAFVSASLLYPILSFMTLSCQSLYHYVT